MTIIHNPHHRRLGLGIVLLLLCGGVSVVAFLSPSPPQSVVIPLARSFPLPSPLLASWNRGTDSTIIDDRTTPHSEVKSKDGFLRRMFNRRGSSSSSSSSSSSKHNENENHNVLESPNREEENRRRHQKDIEQQKHRRRRQPSQEITSWDDLEHRLIGALSSREDDSHDDDDDDDDDDNNINDDDIHGIAMDVIQLIYGRWDLYMNIALTDKDQCASAPIVRQPETSRLRVSQTANGSEYPLLQITTKVYLDKDPVIVLEGRLEFESFFMMGSSSSSSSSSREAHFSLDELQVLGVQIDLQAAELFDNEEHMDDAVTTMMDHEDDGRNRSTRLRP